MTLASGLPFAPAAVFAATPVVLVDGGGRMLAVDGAGWRPGTYRPPAGLQAMVERGHINWVGILFRRAALQTVPALDPETAPSFDLDFELRLAAACPFVICSQPGALMVHHPDSASVAARLSDTWPAFLKIMDNATGAATMPEDDIPTAGETWGPWEGPAIGAARLSGSRGRPGCSRGSR